VIHDATRSRWNLDVWWGLLLALAAMLCNVIFFVNPPVQRAIPWLSLLLAVSALIFLGRGMKLVFGRPRVYRGKILSSIVAAISLLLVSLVLIVFFHARAIPAAAAAPRVGQRAPDFTLTDTSGQPVSFDQLFTPAADDAQATAPKAVLLIFYRGYW
jgi:hypothetical protein